ncbi:MAG TPA: hypothetical protein H9800_00785 [Candidatus Microbacterium stercoravium]|uniref:Membrane protein YmcC n=1 Tax=Candidatus Microbacterium stercoravium TaxID=2838697 RepID=A0A9D2H4G6_9MICO|nr:hypothetical protein [Candidatus Microbacterium stercoravium]
MNIFIVIIACEIGFWVVLVAGLGARYILRRRLLSHILLVCVPLLDLALLTLIAWDLVANGATAQFEHGLGALYLGFSLAFGHRIITVVDGRFAHRFAGAPAPRPIPKHGRERVVHEWRSWARMVVAAVIASAVLGTIIWVVDDAARTMELAVWIARVWFVTAIWLIGWPVWVTVSFLVRGEEPDDALRGRSATSANRLG